MQTAEYFDSVASLWDDDFAESKAARVMAASLSLPESGGYVLDVGCGGGGRQPAKYHSGDEKTDPRRNQVGKQ